MKILCEYCFVWVGNKIVCWCLCMYFLYVSLNVSFCYVYDVVCFCYGIVVCVRREVYWCVKCCSVRCVYVE